MGVLVINLIILNQINLICLTKKNQVHTVKASVGFPSIFTTSNSGETSCEYQKVCSKSSHLNLMYLSFTGFLYKWHTMGFSGWRVFPTQLVCSSSCSAVGCKRVLPKKRPYHKRTLIIRVDHHLGLEKYEYVSEINLRITIKSKGPTLCLSWNMSSYTKTGCKAGGLERLIVSHQFLHSLSKPWCLRLRLF